MNFKQVSEAELHAYADRQLSEERTAEVEEWLISHPEDRRSVDVWCAQNMAILAQYGDDVSLDIPPRLKIDNIRCRPYARYRVAAAMLLFIVGGAVGWLSHSAFRSGENSVWTLTEPAIVAHRVYSVEAQHPVEIDGRQKQQLVRWLSTRLNYPLRVPDLSHEGFHLMGGRLLPAVSKGAAAQFMFGNGSGSDSRITLYCVRSPADKDIAFRYEKDNGVSAFYWWSEGISYAVIGKIQRSDLLQITTSIYKQLSAQPHENNTVL
jgi:anti-sigma factor RsiW